MQPRVLADSLDTIRTLPVSIYVHRVSTLLTPTSATLTEHLRQGSKRSHLLALGGLGTAARRPVAGAAVLLGVSALHGVLQVGMRWSIPGEERSVLADMVG